jgi:hypothetical protein
MNALRRLLLTGVAFGCVSLGGLAPSAYAAVMHKPLFQLAEVPAEGPLGEPVAVPGPPVRDMESLTVDSGHVWVAEGSFRGKSRVDEFDAKTGAFVAQPAHLEAPTEAEFNLPTCYGYACGDGIAIGHGPGEAAVYVAGEKQGVSVVSVLNEAGALKATWNGAATPGGSFGIFTGYGYHVGTISDVAVDNSTSQLNVGKGDVFVAVGNWIFPPATGVIDVFHPEANGEERYVGQITGPSPGEHFIRIPKIAVDEANGDLFVVVEGEKPAVDVFEPTGLGSYAFVRKLSGPPPTGAFNSYSIYAIAVDSTTGEVYVTESLPGGTLRIVQFSATGSYLGQVENVPAGTAAIAVDPESHYLYAKNAVYGPDVVIPDVMTDPASTLKRDSALLNGTVNPDNAGGANCQFDWGTTPALGKVAPCPKEVSNGENQVPVQVSLTGLEPDQTYYYRLQASDENGTNLGEPWQDQSFTTPGAILREESVTDVSSTAATLQATILPDKQSTSYYFQYGTSSEYGQDSSVPPGEAIGAGSADVEVPALRLQSLAPSTVYHYRVVLTSEVKPGELETLYGEDHTFTTQAAGGSFSLLDDRQWQMVSPASKLGALIEPVNRGFDIQASADGDAIAYDTSAPTEAEPQGYALAETVLSTRGAAGWSSQDISPAHAGPVVQPEGPGAEFRLFSSDLSRAAVIPVDDTFTRLSPEATESTSYLRTNFPAGDVEDRCASSCYQPLVSASNTPPGTVFGEEPQGGCTERACGPRFVGASRDLSHVIVASPVQLTSTPVPPGVEGVYEWSAGRLQLVSLLPASEQPAILAGSTYRGAGASGTENAGPRHAVSDDGERVIMEGGVSRATHAGQSLYMRDVGKGETTRLDAVQGGTGPSSGVDYMTASSDASRVFFLDRGHLTAQSSAGGEVDLYEYDLNASVGERLTDLTVDTNAGEAADVEQVIGASEDGGYVYFFARGALAPGARPGGHNLYVRHGGVTKLVAALSEEDQTLYNWGNSDGEAMFARVSPYGEWVAFMSRANLTGYNSRDAVSGAQDAEVYLYNAAHARLLCASCNPTGARPTGLAEWSEVAVFGKPSSVAGFIPAWPIMPTVIPAETRFRYQPRYLSDSGRLFFASSDALVAQDVNGTVDVYEYEPVGVGSCGGSSAMFVAGLDGCLGLVSSGTSPADSAFMDASETGGDVFFRTQARLDARDRDTSYDVYDAHECTTPSSCPVAAPQPPACETEASCRAAPSPQPALYGAPSSATFSGAGNVALAPSRTVESKGKPGVRRAACRKGKRRGRARCRKASGTRRGRAKRAGAGVVGARRGGGR